MQIIKYDEKTLQDVKKIYCQGETCNLDSLKSLSNKLIKKTSHFG